VVHWNRICNFSKMPLMCWQSMALWVRLNFPVGECDFDGRCLFVDNDEYDECHKVKNANTVLQLATRNIWRVLWLEEMIIYKVLEYSILNRVWASSCEQDDRCGHLFPSTSPLAIGQFSACVILQLLSARPLFWKISSFRFNNTRVENESLVLFTRAKSIVRETTLRRTLVTVCGSGTMVDVWPTTWNSSETWRTVAKRVTRYSSTANIFQT